MISDNMMPDSNLREAQLKSELLEMMKEKMSHKTAAMFSKSKEQRFDPKLIPGQNWNEGVNLTPAPNAYSQSQPKDNAAKPGKGSIAVAFAQSKRISFAQAAKKKDVPGPGQYDLTRTYDH